MTLIISIPINFQDCFNFVVKLLLDFNQILFLQRINWIIHNAARNRVTNMFKGA